MVEEQRSSAVDPGFVNFWAAGAPAKGEFHCAECGYGVTVHRQLPTCPMCGSRVWEESAWHPFSRGTELRTRLP